jgi:hypothetical protein
VILQWTWLQFHGGRSQREVLLGDFSPIPIHLARLFTFVKEEKGVGRHENES